MNQPPPPPLQVGNFPPVWRRWFEDVAKSANTTTERVVVVETTKADAVQLDDVYELLASIPERPDMSSLRSRLMDVEGELAALAVPNVSDILRRLAALEAASGGTSFGGVFASGSEPAAGAGNVGTYIIVTAGGVPSIAYICLPLSGGGYEWKGFAQSSS